MTLQASGAISISNINVELGLSATATNSLNDASFRTLAGIASGGISMSNFHGKSNAFVFNQTISVNTIDYNIKSAAIAGGWNQIKPLKATVTVNSGIYVYASTTSVYGMQTGSTFPAGTTLAVINNGLIVGRGGKGGNGSGGGSNVNNGQPGLAGGVGFLASTAVSITNNGTVGGGGGGGGGAGGAVFTGATGGGGGGRVLGAGGGGLTGNAGTLTAAGAGRGGGPGGAGTSGAGGNLGTAGSAGTDGGGGGGPGAGGAAGACTTGNANITWVATGTRSGALN